MNKSKIIGVAAILLIFTIFRCACSSDEKETIVLTPKQIEQQKEDSLKDDRESKIDYALTVLKMKVKDNMKDPSSFDMVNRTWDHNDSLKDKVKLQIKFRGNNSFGGKGLNVVNGTYNFKTDQVVITEVIPL